MTDTEGALRQPCPQESHPRQTDKHFVMKRCLLTLERISQEKRQGNEVDRGGREGTGLGVKWLIDERKESWTSLPFTFLSPPMFTDQLLDSVSHDKDCQCQSLKDLVIDFFF